MRKFLRYPLVSPLQGIGLGSEVGDIVRRAEDMRMREH